MEQYTAAWEQFNTGINSPGFTGRSLFFYPNPTASYIAVPSLKKEDRLSITNAQGQTVADFYAENSETLDVSFLANGIYTMTLSGKNNDVLARGKFAITK